MSLYIINYYCEEYGFIGKTVRSFCIQEELDAFVEREEKRLSARIGTDIIANIIKQS